MKVSELTNDQLDCWAWTAEGNPETGGRPYSPSKDWAQGGPIIERMRINIVDHAAYQGELLRNKDEQFAAFIGDPWQLTDCESFSFYDTAIGPTPLIAAMRAYVTARFGDELPEAKPWP